MPVSTGVPVLATGYLGVDRTSTYVLSSAEERQVVAVPWMGAGGAAVRSGLVPGSGSLTPVSATATAWSLSTCKVAFSDGAGGVWEVNIPSTLTEAMPTAPGAGTTRYDALVITPFDTGAISGRFCKVQLVSGTAAGTPALAATLALVPAGAYVLASMLTSNTGPPVVTQGLPRTVTAGGLLPVASPGELNAIVSPYDGLVAYQEDVKQFLGRVNGAWAPLGGGPHFKGSLTVATAIGAGANLTFPSVEDTDAGWGGSSYTVKRAGVYRLAVYFKWNGSPPTNATVIFKKGASTVFTSGASGAAPAFGGMNAFHEARCAVNDVLAVQSGVAFTTVVDGAGVDNNAFFIDWLRP